MSTSIPLERQRELMKACSGTVEQFTLLNPTPEEISCNKYTYGNSLLTHAYHLGNYKLVDFLVENGADIDAYDSSNVKPIIHAVKDKRIDVALFLIKKGAKLSDPELICAIASNGLVKLLELLIERKINVLVSYGNGTTALHSACLNDQYEIAKILLKNGADPNAYKQNSLSTPLHIAAFRGNKKISTLLLKYGANMCAKDTYLDMTPVHYACHAGMPAVLALFFAKGADKHVEDYKKMTPLHEACRECRFNIVMFLLNNNVNVNAIDSSGWTPLFWTIWATKKISVRTMTELLNKDAQINIKDRDGDTPLHKAVSIESYEKVKLLLDHGADPTIRNNKNLRPIDLIDDKDTMIKELFEDFCCGKVVWL